MNPTQMKDLRRKGRGYHEHT